MMCFWKYASSYFLISHQVQNYAYRYVFECWFHHNNLLSCRIETSADRCVLDREYHCYAKLAPTARPVPIDVLPVASSFVTNYLADILISQLIDLSLDASLILMILFAISSRPMLIDASLAVSWIVKTLLAITLRPLLINVPLRVSLILISFEITSRPLLIDVSSWWVSPGWFNMPPRRELCWSMCLWKSVSPWWFDNHHVASYADQFAFESQSYHSH